MGLEEYRFSKEHEWVRVVQGRTALIGITDYAQKQLGDVVFLSVPEGGARVRQFQKFGEIESVKAVSDLFAPASGRVVEVNGEAVQHPELVNQDPYERGWLLRVELDDLKDLERLMSHNDYQSMVQGKT